MKFYVYLALLSTAFSFCDDCPQAESVSVSDTALAGMETGFSWGGVFGGVTGGVVIVGAHFFFAPVSIPLACAVALGTVAGGTLGGAFGGLSGGARGAYIGYYSSNYQDPLATARDDGRKCGMVSGVLGGTVGGGLVYAHQGIAYETAASFLEGFKVKVGTISSVTTSSLGWIRDTTEHWQTAKTSGVTYLKAYHGTKASSVASILEHGLLRPGELTSDGDKVSICPGHILESVYAFGDGKDFTDHVFVTPSFEYASKYAGIGGAVLEVLVPSTQPFQMFHETIGAGQNIIDPKVPNDKIEWLLNSGRDLIISAVYRRDASFTAAPAA